MYDDWEIGQSVEVRYGGNEYGGTCGDCDKLAIADWREY